MRTYLGKGQLWLLSVEPYVKKGKLKETWTYDGTVFVKLNNSYVKRLTRWSDYETLEEELSLKIRLSVNK